jgi:hypothetical protein
MLYFLPQEYNNVTNTPSYNNFSFNIFYIGGGGISYGSFAGFQSIISQGIGIVRNKKPRISLGPILTKRSQ